MRLFALLCLFVVGTFCELTSAGLVVAANTRTTASVGNTPTVRNVDTVRTATVVKSTDTASVGNTVDVVAAPAPAATSGKASLVLTSNTVETAEPTVKLTVVPETRPMEPLVVEPVQTLPADLTGADTTDFIGEFESALTDNQRNHAMYRSEASRGQTLRLTRDDRGREFRISLCARSPLESGSVAFRVQDIQFSNDGPGDRIYLELNGQPLGEAMTGDDYRNGQGWNVFRNTGAVGPVRRLKNGDHTLTVRVETDQWGIELDTLTIRARGQADNELFMCRAVLV